MGEFDSDDHYICYCVQESPRRNGHSQQKNLKCSTWVHLKNYSIILVHFQGKPFNIMVIQVYAPASNAEKAEVEPFYTSAKTRRELTVAQIMNSLLPNSDLN